MGKIRFTDLKQVVEGDVIDDSKVVCIAKMVSAFYERIVRVSFTTKTGQEGYYEERYLKEEDRDKAYEAIKKYLEEHGIDVKDCVYE